MSLVSKRKSINSRSSSRRLSSDSFRSKKSVYSQSFTSEHGSKFGRSVSKFPKPNDPDLIQSVSIVNSRVIQAIINFPVKITSKLPDLTQTEATDCIRELGSFMNILDYEFNYTSFWLLDIISKIIKHMQLKELPVTDQNICLSWFRYVLRCISISGDSREEIFGHLQNMFLKAEEFIRSGDLIPQPEEIIIVEKRSTKLGAGDSGSVLSSKSLHTVSSKRKRSSQKSSRSIRKSSLNSRTSNRSRSSKSSKSNARSSFVNNKVEINLQTLNSIIEIIYNVFADRFIFSLISQAYSSPTIVAPVEIPIEFKDPKLIRPPIVITPPVSPSSKKTSASKSKKKGKDKGIKGRKESPSSKHESETEDKDATSSKKKGKGKDASSKKSEGKGGKGNKKSKPSLNNEEGQEPKDQPKEKGEKGKKKSKPSLNNEDIQAKEKGKEPKGKSKKKSKSSEDVKITHKNKEDVDIKSTDTSIKKIKKSITLEEAENIRRLQIEEKLKLFDRPIAPDMKLEMKKMEVKDKFILPLSEGVSKGYVENLIKSILPQEAKPSANTNVPKGKSEGKSSSSLEGKKKKSSSLEGKKKKSSSLEGKKKKSSSLEGKKKKSSKADKKAKGKKK